MPTDAVPVDPATLSLDLSTESATTALFRAAIGPVGANHYLPVFARFDLADRAGSGWNWAACLCTLGWMVFRRLWGAALLYVGVLAGVALLAAALVGLVLEVPQQVQWGIALALLLAAYVVPGAWGDAWLYGHCRRRMADALARSSSWSDAVALLEREALRPSRAWWLALAYAVLLGGSAGLVGTLPELPLAASARGPASDAPRASAPTASAPLPASSAAMTTASAAAAEASPASASAPAAAGAASGASGSVTVPASVSVPVSAPASVPVSASTTPPASAAGAAPPVPASPASGVAPRSAPPAATTSAPRVLATTTSVPAVPARAVSASRRSPLGAAGAPAPAVSPSAPVSPQDPAQVSAESPGGRYLVNIGLFAVDANARKAEATLRGAGVRLLVQELQTRNGKRTRGRAGPYQTLSEAEAAATTVRALGLEAQVARQPAEAGR